MDTDPMIPSHMQGTIGGDSKYMASEILEGTYTKACDVFSLGVTMLELATDLDLPNGGCLWHQLREEGPDPMLCKNLSLELHKTLKLMMGRDHERRPNVDQLLQLPSVRRAARARPMGPVPTTDTAVLSARATSSERSSTLV